MEQQSENVLLQVDAVGVVNFALQQNKGRFVQKVSVENRSGEALTDLVLEYTGKPEFCFSGSVHIDLVEAGCVLELKDVQPVLDAAFMAAVTERCEAMLRFTLKREEAVLSSHDVTVTVLSFDEWHGCGYYPELLSAFVTPNHPEIAGILTRAAEFLGKWTGDPSLDGYQSQDINRILSQAAAVYEAIRELGIVYAVPPASFEAVGQRVRLCDTVLSSGLGTCLDLSLLYASCLEAAGLHPILLLKKGHAFAGVWLEELSFPEAVQDDASMVSKRLGVHEIAVVECTAMVSGKECEFDKAQKLAEQALIGEDALEYLIDVHRARRSGIVPLPLRIRDETGWHIQSSVEKKGDMPAAPTEVSAAAVGEGAPSDFAFPKMVQWERKLLDLGLRNQLINMRFSKTLLPILTTSLDELENALSDGRDFSIHPKPAEWNASGSSVGFETMHDTSACGDLLRDEFKNRRLRSVYTEAELDHTVKGLYRNSKTALEENGANTLYLALGVLRWYETDRSTKPRYAPVVLIPVEIVRKSAMQGYVIRLRDDEPQMNITMLEKLKQDFGILVSGLDPLPQDDHGIDIRTVFTVLRKAVMAQSRWDVLESAYLGIFSFTQFVMWNDMRNRCGDLEKNKIVRSLMDGKLCWEGADLTPGDRVPEENVFLPMSADASQLRAIEAAGDGESFVLHGPPGTGKSQTITVLIANALAQGKSVLFVAEKMAALEVVQKRLDRIGLGPFCLELHSNKSKKRDVLDQLKQATEVTKQTTAEAYAAKAEQIAALRQELNDYADALHTVRTCGMTLFDLVSAYENDREAPDLSAFTDEFVRKLTLSDLLNQKGIVERLVAAAGGVGHPAGHPLSRVGQTQYSQTLRMGVETGVDSYCRALTELASAGELFQGLIGRPAAGNRTQWDELWQIGKELSFWLTLPKSWAVEDDLSACLSEITAMAEHSIKAGEIRCDLSALWTDPFFELDGSDLAGRWREAEGKWFLPKLLGQNKIVKQVSPYGKTTVEKEKLLEQLDRLAVYRQERSAAESLLVKRRTTLEYMYRDGQTDWHQVRELAGQAQTSAVRLASLTGGHHLRKNLGTVSGLEEALNGFLKCWEKAESAYDELNRLLHLKDTPDENWLRAELALCDSLRENLEGLKDWLVWNDLAQQAEEAGLSSVTDAYRQGMEHKAVLPAYQKAIYKALAMAAITDSPALNTFSGIVFNEKVTQFKKIDQELTELTQQEIYCRLASRVPNFTKEAAQSSELGILQRAIRSGGRGVSIRKLFEQLPNLLPRLCPCMLMSPISAAQYLDPKREPFQIVVFDEASQLPTCKAVGALARGKEAVIVGDPKQMPPTTFFATNTVDEENLDTEDLESILDDCLAMNIPQTHLLWHYRSRHESLIAFSNRQFYENKLYTFPSVNDRESKVRLVPVQGVFERGKNRQNRAEAEAVVAELKRRSADPVLSGMSIGVVTFNISQQNLIDDLLMESCKEDPNLESWLYSGEEPVFIKNLENVQGDERDVILFSVGYGPDHNGKVYMNFGPLNRDGGWRRLNVAVTRARQEMVVFSTLTADQINLSRTNAEGVAALKAFLEYAGGKRMNLQDPAQAASLKTSGIAERICAFLKENGYETDCNVGHSAYRVDIGVIDPANPDVYVLGILLDGKVYGEAKTARDREFAQIGVLNGLGWNIHRVWTMDWWDNSRKEMNRILEKLKTLKEQKEPDPLPPKPEAPQPPEPALIASQVTVPEERTNTYIAAKLKPLSVASEDLLSGRYTNSIQSRIRQILQQEAPISEALLIKRLIQSYGLTRSGSRLQERLEQVFASMQLRTTVQDGQRFFWKEGQAPEAYTQFRVNGEGANKRDVKDVPVEEAVNALRQTLQDQISLNREDLLREGAKLLGYSRSGTVVTGMMERALEKACSDGVIAMDGNEKWILTES